MDEKRPLVSIIVRTKDRPKLLKWALKSISAQTYRPIEVVLVNDGGCDLDIDDMKGILGDISLNYVRLEKNTGRAHAGNVGVENTRGEYVGFLDDDDELYPSHLGSLVPLLESSDCKVAYTAVACVEKTCGSDFDDCSEKVKFLYAKDFSSEELLKGNYIPLMSLLFRAEILGTIAFDESFELYEDWEMLLRVAEKSDFKFINEVTAKYNQWSGTQIAFQTPPEIMEKTIARVYAKHWNKIPPDVMGKISRENVAKDIAIMDRESRIEELENLVGDRDSRIVGLEALLDEKERALRDIHRSRGWKALTLYYKIRDRLFR